MTNYFDIFAEIQKNRTNLNGYNRLKYDQLDHKKELNQHPDWITSIKPSNDQANKYSGLFLNKTQIMDKVITSLPFTFAIYGKFTLNASFYSADDDRYYIIDNPVLKEKVFKVPMFRGSGWKGIAASAIREVMKIKIDCFFENMMSFARLFGAGSEEFRDLITDVKEKHLKENDKIFTNHLRLFALKSLGMKLNLKDDNLDEKIWKKIIDNTLQVQRGRLIFYPTYFDKVGLEMINPHKRRTKAGTKPVYYEVVPKGASGIFQLFYIPADGVIKSNKELQKEADDDLNLLSAGLQRIFREQTDDGQVKIGAKTRLGWGKVSANYLDFIRRKGDSLKSPDPNFLKEYSSVSVVNATGREVQNG